MRLGRLAALILVLGSVPAAAGEPFRLFQRPPQPTGRVSHQAALAEYEVDIALNGLAEATRLTIDLPDGRSMGARRTALEIRRRDDFSWRGKIQATGGDGDLVIAVKGPSVAGVIFGVDGTFEIVPGTRGGHRLVQVDESRFDPCLEPPVPAPVAELSPDRSATAEATAEVAPFAPAEGDSSARLDVLVVYTAAARSAAGGTTGILSTIQSAVDVANAAYANSQVVPRMRLVHTAEVGYAETGNIQGDLGWLTGDPAVARLREAYAADMVSLVVDNGGGYCGVGWLQHRAALGAGFAPNAFQVTARDCAAANITLAHEFGHNQGAEHDPANGNPPATASYDWAFGHFHDLGGTSGYRTVMSYSTGCAVGCPRAPYFSNSGVTYKGQATGVLDERENYRTLNATAPYVANFRRRGLLADLSGDNRPDILWYHRTSGAIYAWNMSGTTPNGGASLGQLADGGWRIVGVRDFSNDGNADLLWRDTVSGSIYVWTMNGSTRTGGAFVGQVSDARWRIVGTGDFNGDKRPDILWHHAATGEVYVWTMNGSTQTGGALVGQATIDWGIAGVGDFTGDGRVDILWQNAATGSLYVWFMNGTAQSGGVAMGGSSGTSWKVAGVGDFNGDARADVLWRDDITGTVYIWAMDGTTATGGVTVGQVADAGWSIVAPR